MQTRAHTHTFLHRAGVLAGRLLVVDAAGGNFRTIKLRGKRPDCVMCGQGENKMTSLLDNYETFCHMEACDATRGIEVRPKESRITAAMLHDAFASDAGMQVGWGNAFCVCAYVCVCVCVCVCVFEALIRLPT